MNNCANIALQWNREGINVLPLRFRSKRPFTSWKKWQVKTQGSCLVRWWFERKYPVCNLGVMCGGELVVVDFDSYPSWLSWNPKGELKESYRVSTGRGIHVYFWLREKIWMTMGFEGGEIKGNGYVVAPPSIHPSGKEYKWLGGSIMGIGSVDDLSIQYKVQQVAIGNYPQRRVITTSTGVIGKIKRTLAIKCYLAKITKNFVIKGDQLMCSCPFHNDSNPSMIIHENEEWCYCFSPACIAHKRLDVIDVAALYFNVSNKEAIRLLSYEVD